MSDSIGGLAEKRMLIAWGGAAACSWDCTAGEHFSLLLLFLERVELAELEGLVEDCWV